MIKPPPVYSPPRGAIKLTSSFMVSPAACQRLWLAGYGTNILTPLSGPNGGRRGAHVSDVDVNVTASFPSVCLLCLQRRAPSPNKT